MVKQKFGLVAFVGLNSLILGTAFTLNRRMMRNKRKDLEKFLGNDSLAKAGVVAITSGSLMIGLYISDKLMRR